VIFGRLIRALIKSDRAAFIEFLLEADTDEIVTLEEVMIEVPEKAQVRASVVCENCGEAVMDTRIIERQGRKICIPCNEITGRQPV